MRQALVQLREAEAELRNVQEWARLVQQAVADYQREAQRLAALIGDDLPKATALLGRSSSILLSYAAMSAPAAVAGVVTGSMGAADATDSGSTATQPAAPSSEQDWFRSRMAALTPHQRGAWGEATLLAEIHRLQHRVLIEHFGQSTQPGYDCASWDGHTLHVWEAKNYSVRETDKAGVVYDLNALYHHRVAANVRQFLKDLPENDSDRAGIPTPTWSQRRRCSSWNRSSHRRRQRRAKATPATRSGEVSMAGLNTQVTELDDDWRALRQRWEDVKAVWNDPVRWNFEKEHWESLEKQAEATRREMARLADVIARARQSVK